MDDLESLAQNPWKPNLSKDLVKQMVRQIYGLEVIQIKHMVSFNDQNFHIKVSEKHKNVFVENLPKDGYTFKIINTKKSDIKGHFDSMHSVLLHLNKNELNVPLPILNLDGSTWKCEDVPLLHKVSDTSTPIVKGKCGIHILKYMPGVPLSSIDWTDTILFDWGLLLAKFHNAMQDYVDPDLYEKNIIYSLHNVNIMANLPDLGAEIQQVIEETLDEYNDKIKPHFNELHKGFLHGDFNDNNVLIENKRDQKEAENIYSILDFEDLHWGAYVWDVGLMMAHVLINSKASDPLEDMGFALAGYLSMRQFNELDLSVLKTCIECRLCQALAFCTFSRGLQPNNEYIIGLSLDKRIDQFNQLRSCTNSDLLVKWKTTRQKLSQKFSTIQ